MRIEHLQLNWEDLPALDEVILQPVEKNYLKVIYAEWGIFFSIILLTGIGLFYFLSNMQDSIFALCAILIFLSVVSVTYILAKKSFSCRAYAIREKDVIVQKGWLFQELKVLPISNIQHCTITTGPLEKKLQLATLKLFAAGQQSRLTLSGLKTEQAEKLKEWIVSKKQEHAA